MFDYEWCWKQFLFGYEYKAYINRHLFYFGFLAIWVDFEKDIKSVQEFNDLRKKD